MTSDYIPGYDMVKNLSSKSHDCLFFVLVVSRCYNQPLTKPVSIGWWQPLFQTSYLTMFY